MCAADAQSVFDSLVLVVGLYVLSMLCLGNTILHQLTTERRMVLRVELTDWDGATRYAEFDNFRVGSEAEKFKLISVGSYSGTAGQYEYVQKSFS